MASALGFARSLHVEDERCFSGDAIKAREKHDSIRASVTKEIK